MMVETTLIAITLVLMLVLLLVSLIPYVPGPALQWAVGTIFAVLTDFQRVTVAAVVVMSIFMLIGSTNEIWLRYLGMRGRGGSCWGALGSLVGGIIGTGVIPIPILGTLIGAIVGALLVEFMRIGEVQHAMQAGRSVLETYILSIIIEFFMSLAILGTFLGSLWFTRA